MQKEYLIQILAAIGATAAATYFPLWARLAGGLTDSEIAIIATVFATVSFLTSSLIGRLSDITAKRKFYILFGLLAGFVAFSFYIFPKTFIEFLLVRSFTGIGLGMYPPVLVALISDRNGKVGHFSALGSLGWAIGNITAGILGLMWIPSAFLLAAACYLVAVGIAWNINENPVSLTKSWRDSLWQVFLQRKIIYITFTIRHSFASAVWTFWPLLLFNMGADTFWIGVIQMTNSLTQFVVMNTLTDRMASEHMILLGDFCTALFFLSVLFAPNYFFIIPTQFILGFSWSFLYVGSLRQAIEKSDYDHSTAAGLLNATSSISVIIGSLIAVIVSSLGGTYSDLLLYAAIAGVVSFVVYVSARYLFHMND